MSVFNGFGSVMGKIFVSEKSVEKAIDSVTSGIDKIWYTKEERADNEEARWNKQFEARAKAQELMLDWMKASQGHNVARRWLTVQITRVWLWQMILGMAFAVASVWAKEPDRLLATAGIMQGYAAEMGAIVMIIVLFYFAAPHMGEALNILLQRLGLRVPDSSKPAKG